MEGRTFETVEEAEKSNLYRPTVAKIVVAEKASWQEFLFGSSFFLQYNDGYPRDNNQEMYKLTFQL